MTTSLKILTFLCFLCSFIYNYYYWQAFGIQPYTYMDFSTAVANSVKPFFIMGIFLFLMTMLYTIIPDKIDTDNDSHKILIASIIAIYTAVILWFISYTHFNFWVLGFVCILILKLTIKLGNTCFYINIIKYRSARLAVFIAAGLFPMLSLFMAVNQVDNIKNRSNYSIINNNDILNDPDVSKKNNEMIFLGKIGDYVFLLQDKSNDVFTYHFQALRKLHLIDRGKTKELATEAALRASEGDHQDSEIKKLKGGATESVSKQP